MLVLHRCDTNNFKEEKLILGHGFSPWSAFEVDHHGGQRMMKQSCYMAVGKH
jgi:hypothetical protein